MRAFNLVRSTTVAGSQTDNIRSGDPHAIKCTNPANGEINIHWAENYKDTGWREYAYLDVAPNVQYMSFHLNKDFAISPGIEKQGCADKNFDQLYENGQAFNMITNGGSESFVNNYPDVLLCTLGDKNVYFFIVEI